MPAKVAQVASVEPHMALKSVAPTTVVIASPPGIWPTNFDAPPYSFLAMSEFDATWPMRTNRGITVKP